LNTNGGFCHGTAYNNKLERKTYFSDTGFKKEIVKIKKTKNFFINN